LVTALFTSLAAERRALRLHAERGNEVTQWFVFRNAIRFGSLRRKALSPRNKESSLEPNSKKERLTAGWDKRDLKKLLLGTRLVAQSA
jgi:hypothetical protein